MGVITKPDTLLPGSKSEIASVNPAQNMDVEFRLGWPLEARNASEKQFFDQGIWTTLPREIVHISTLRERLSEVLVDQITSKLPTLLGDIEENILLVTQRLLGSAQIELA